MHLVAHESKVVRKGNSNRAGGGGDHIGAGEGGSEHAPKESIHNTSGKNVLKINIVLVYRYCCSIIVILYSTSGNLEVVSKTLRSWESGVEFPLA